jgi:hypothetical protein
MPGKDTTKLLAELRSLMQNLDVTGGDPLAAYIIGSGDAHSVS